MTVAFRDRYRGCWSFSYIIEEPRRVDAAPALQSARPRRQAPHHVYRAVRTIASTSRCDDEERVSPFLSLRPPPPSLPLSLSFSLVVSSVVLMHLVAVFRRTLRAALGITAKHAAYTAARTLTSHRQFEHPRSSDGL